MKVLFLSAEVAPFTKIGGLGDVAGSLPRALRALPDAPDVRVMTPLHGGARQRLTGPLERIAEVVVPHPSGPISGEILATEHDGVPIYFVASSLWDERAPVYQQDSGLDAHRFVFFSLAALAFARQIDFVPDVVHAHDWHTAAAIAAVHRARFHDPAFGRTRTLLTVHNLPYLGYDAGPVMHAYGLVPGELRWVPPALNDLPLPIGIALADRITTVSPGYAREILGSEFGAGLEPLLHARRDQLVGILNGIDLEAWNPARDRALTSRYELGRLEQRAPNKTALQRELGLALGPLPLIAVVSRLTHQKGIDLVPDALRALASSGAFQAVILGTGDRDLEEELLRLGGELIDAVRVRIGFDEALSRRIYAGADFLVLPSRYEPCGLTQMIAMRYGCVPVARDTGGLSDTVRDIDLHEESTGFLFPVASSSSVAFGLRRALATYARADRHRALQQNGMREDFSWARAASMYSDLYDALTPGDSR